MVPRDDAESVEEVLQMHVFVDNLTNFVSAGSGLLGLRRVVPYGEFGSKVAEEKVTF